MNAQHWIYERLPWLALMPELAAKIEQMIDEGYSAEEIKLEVRATPEWKARFPGMYDERGEMRFTSEREYLEYEDRINNVLKDFGMYDPAHDTPQNMSGFMELGVDANEIRDRLQVYRELERGTQSIRDAFYVYAGLDLSVDDLYRSVVDPNFRGELQTAYDQAVSTSTLDYDTYVTRTTEVALKRTAEMVERLVENGTLTNRQAASLLNVDPETARQVVGALVVRGVGQTGRYLTIDETLAAFHYAAVGSAALETGLELPTNERADELVKAGVDRAKALQAYSTFSNQRGLFAGMASRTGLASDFTQEDFELAAMIGKGRTVDLLTRMTQQETALGRGRSSFGVDLEGSRITQRGRRFD